MGHGNPLRIAEAEQVDVTRRAVGLARPQREESGSLQYKAFGVGGFRQPIKQTLVRVARKHQLKVLAALPRKAK